MIVHERADIGGEEVLSPAAPDYQGRVAACADDDTGLVLMDGQKRERSAQARHHDAECLIEVVGFLILGTQEDGGHLGVGFRGEGEPLCGELIFEFLVVLDDSVVYQREFAVVAEVGMRIGICRGPVRCPAGMSNSGVPLRQGLVRQGICEHIQFPGFLAGVHGSVIADDSDASRVISAVFQPFQTGEKNVNRIIRAHVAHNSAHGTEYR